MFVHKASSSLWRVRYGVWLAQLVLWYSSATDTKIQEVTRKDEILLAQLVCNTDLLQTWRNRDYEKIWGIFGCHYVPSAFFHVQELQPCHSKWYANVAWLSFRIIVHNANIKEIHCFRRLSKLLFDKLSWIWCDVAHKSCSSNPWVVYVCSCESGLGTLSFWDWALDVEMAVVKRLRQDGVHFLIFSFFLYF